MGEVAAIKAGTDPQTVTGKVVPTREEAREARETPTRDVFTRTQPLERRLGVGHLAMGMGMAGVAVLGVATGRVPATEALAFAGIGAFVGGLIGGGSAIEDREPPAQAARYALALAAFLGAFGAFGWTILSKFGQ